MIKESNNIRSPLNAEVIEGKKSEMICILVISYDDLYGDFGPKKEKHSKDVKKLDVLIEFWLCPVS